MDGGVQRDSASGSANESIPLHNGRANKRKGQKRRSKRRSRDQVEGAKAPRGLGVAYAVFVMLGIASLISWNAYITAYDYFHKPYGENIEFIFGLAYMWPNLIGLFPLLAIGPLFPFSLRIIVGLSIIVLTLVATVLIVAFPPPDVLGAILLVMCVAVSGATGALLQGSVFGLASVFPAVSMSGVMGGQGFAGIGINICRILTKLTMPNTESGDRDSSAIYFSIATFVVILSIVSMILFMCMPVYRFYVRKRKPDTGGKDDRCSSWDAADDVPQQESVSVGGEVASVAEEVNICEEEIVAEEFALAPAVHIENVQAEPVEAAGDEIGSVIKPGILPRIVRGLRDRLVVLWKVRMQGFNVFFIFFVTLSLFPGVTSMIPSHGHDNDWFVILLITVFNAMDTVGRNLPRFFVGVKPKFVIYFALARVVFYPLFILCVTPPLFKSDYIAYVIMAIFALSNGFFSSVAMMFGPDTPGVLPEEKEYTGVWMALLLNVGLSFGVTFGYILGLIV